MPMFVLRSTPRLAVDRAVTEKGRRAGLPDLPKTRREQILVQVGSGCCLLNLTLISKA